MKNLYSWQERPNVRTFLLESIPPLLGTVGIVAALLIPALHGSGVAFWTCAPAAGHEVEVAAEGGQHAGETAAAAKHDGLGGYGPSAPRDNFPYLSELFATR